jgi:hypothetical protein
MGVDGVDMRLPAYKRHVMPGPEQQSPIIASDRSGADDCNLHAFLPFGGSSERAKGPANARPITRLSVTRRRATNEGRITPFC